MINVCFEGKRTEEVRKTERGCLSKPAFQGKVFYCLIITMGGVPISWYCARHTDFSFSFKERQMMLIFLNKPCNNGVVVLNVALCVF